jgi:LysM repeat protein
MVLHQAVRSGHAMLEGGEMRGGKWVVTSILLSLVLVAGCATIPWAAKKESARPAAGGSGEARLLSTENVLPIASQGDVWLVPEAGGDPVRVTYSGRTSDPTVSADGQALAYVLSAGAGGEVAQAELHVMVLDTGDTFVAASGVAPWGPPAWSPDGGYLAWPLADALYVMQVPSGHELATYVADLPGASRPAPVWSADSAVLYYPLVVDGRPVLHALSIEGEPSVVGALDTGTVPVIAVASDGRVALWQPAGLLIAGPEGSGMEAQPVVLPAARGEAVAMAWSPEGESLALVDAGGALWVGGEDGFAGEPQYQAAGLSDVRWLSAEALALWQSPSPGVDALLRVSLPDFTATALGTVPRLSIGSLAEVGSGPTPTGEPSDGFWYTVRPGDTLWDISLRYGTTVAVLASINSISNPDLIYVGQILWIPGGPAPTAQPGTATVVPATATVAVTATLDPYPGPSPSSTVDSYPGPSPTVVFDPYPGPTAIETVVPDPTWTVALTATLPGVTPTETLVPAVTPTEGPGVWYTVTWGDTLGNIAARYGVTVEAIAQANGITNPNLIRLGQRLWIPLSGAPPTPTITVTPTLGPTFEYVVQQGDSLTIIASRYGTTWQVLAQINGLNAWSIIYPGQRLLVPAVPTATPTSTPVP